MARRFTKEDIDRFFDYGVHPDSRTIYLGGDIDFLSAEQAIKGMHLLKVKDASAEIEIILNSPGGDIFDGFAIYDMIKSLDKINVTISVLGQAMSMGAIILQAADERVIHPNACIMIHDGYSAHEDYQRNTEVWAKYMRENRQEMYKLFAKKTGQTSKFWERKCATDCIFTAEQALEMKLVDKIYGRE